MKQKSLRRLAKELGVSHSYLSQVKHGKRPPSAKLVSRLVSNGKQNDTSLLDTDIANSYNKFCAEVAQSVEQRTENPRVPSSILGLGTKAEVVQR